jgi:predicted phosphodiesterase
VRKTLILIAISICLGVLSTFLGLRLSQASDHSTVLGTVSVTIAPAWSGQVEAYVPLADWGVRTHPFWAPIVIRLEPRAIDRQAALAMAGRSDPLLRAAERDLTGAVESAALQSLGWIVLIAILCSGLTILLARRFSVSIWWGLGPLLSSLFMALAIIVLMLTTFQTSALERPTYWAKGGELPQLLKFATRANQASDSYRSSVWRGLTEFSAALAGKPLGASGHEAWLISDLHNNPLPLKSIRKLAQTSPVFAVGDFTHEGGSSEISLMTKSLKGLGNPLVAVSGNHDSSNLMRRLSKQGVIVLTDKGRLLPNGKTKGPPFVYVDKLKVMGFSDPMEGKFNQRDLDNSSVQKIGSSMAAEALKVKPNILMIHNVGIAKVVAAKMSSQKVFILTGHDHRQQISRYGKAFVIDAGSAGAGGIFGVGRQPIGIARLMLDYPGISAVDLIRLEPLSGDGQSERIIFGPGESCHKQSNYCIYTYQSSPDRP